MKTFTIDSKNVITADASDAWVGEGAVKFQMEQELAALAATWPGSRLVEIWNNLKGVTSVTKFTDRKTAVSRIWSAIQQIEPVNSSPRKPKVAAAKKGAPSQKISGESKTDRVLAALRSPNGATLKELMKVTGWQSHSVRGFLSAQVTKRMGLRVKSSKRDGERVYRLRS